MKLLSIQHSFVMTILLISTLFLFRK